MIKLKVVAASRLKFISNKTNCTLNYKNKCPRRAIAAWSKHGLICLYLPCKTDLTIFMDVSRNPGPDLSVKTRHFERYHSTISINAVCCLSVDKDMHSRHVVLGNRDQSSMYRDSSCRYRSMKTHPNWNFAATRQTKWRKYRGCRAGKKVRARRLFKQQKIDVRVNQRLPLFHISGTGNEGQKRNKSTNVNNLITIATTPSSPKISTRCINCCLLNARSVRNKTMAIKDFNCPNRNLAST